MKKQDYRIVVLQRGWVVVGNCSFDGPYLTITDASVIRKWGTKKGLGELAENGPLSETILDPAGTVGVHELAVVMTIETEASKWES